MKTLTCLFVSLFVSLTLSVGTCFAQDDPPTTKLKSNDKSPIKTSRPQSAASSVLTRRPPPERVEAEKLAEKKQQAKAKPKAKKAVKKISQSKSKLNQLNQQTKAVKAARPKASTSKSKTSSSKLKASSSKLKASSSKLKASGTKPKASGSKPMASSSKLKTTGSKPTASASKLNATGAKPLKTGQNNKIATTQPKSALKKPTAAGQFPGDQPKLAKSKGIQFNKQVQVKKIPTNNIAGLKPKPKQPLAKPYAKHGSLDKPFSPKKTTAATASKSKPNAISPKKTTAATATKLKPNANSSTLAKGKPSKLGKFGKAAGVAGGAAVVAGGAMSLAEAKKNRDAGKISQKEYNKQQATNTVKLGGEVAKLKKFSPTGILLNDVVGTDPISLGVEGIGDLINGTNNAQQSFKNMEKSWNKSLTKQTFTDPKGAAKRVGSGVKEAGQNIGEFGQKAGNTISQGAKQTGQAIAKSKVGQTVGNNINKTGNDIKKVGQAVGNSKAGKAVGNTAKKAGEAIGGLFKKKKK